LVQDIVQELFRCSRMEGIKLFRNLSVTVWIGECVGIAKEAKRGSRGLMGSCKSGKMSSVRGLDIPNLAKCKQICSFNAKTQTNLFF
jgi:hypothetical protein